MCLKDRTFSHSHVESTSAPPKHYLKRTHVRPRTWTASACRVTLTGSKKKREKNGVTSMTSHGTREWEEVSWKGSFYLLMFWGNSKELRNRILLYVSTLYILILGSLVNQHLCYINRDKHEHTCTLAWIRFRTQMYWGQKGTLRIA